MCAEQGVLRIYESSTLKSTYTRTPKHTHTRAHSEFPVGEENYELLEDCGRGVSATVRERKGRRMGLTLLLTLSPAWDRRG